jgi:hypothetical protein
MSSKKIAMPKAGDWIEITARKCSDKVSPLLQIGKRFVVKDIAALQDGTPVIEVVHPTRKKAVLRVSTAKFGWKAITIETLREEQFKKEVAEDTSKLISEFTVDEQVNIAFVPLILNHIAWIYALKAVQKSVDYRVELLKKITRQIRALRTEYEREIAKDLDYRHQKHIESETERFIAEFQKDFTILYFSVNQEFKRKMPNWPYDDLRSFAIISILMIRLVDEHNKRMDKLIASRLGKSNPAVRMPIMDALYHCMEAFAGEVGKFNYSDNNVKLSMNVIVNDIKKIDFDIL